MSRHFLSLFNLQISQCCCLDTAAYTSQAHVLLSQPENTTELENIHLVRELKLSSISMILTSAETARDLGCDTYHVSVPGCR